MIDVAEQPDAPSQAAQVVAQLDLKLQEIDPDAEVKALRNPIDAAAAGIPMHCTDLGNAERFAYYARNKAVYCEERKTWMTWDGRRWSPSDTGVIRLAIDILRKIPHEVSAFRPYAGMPDDAMETALKALRKHALASERSTAPKAMLELARAMPGMCRRSKFFDRDPLLFTCKNGTINLRTGELKPHDPRDYITMQSEVKYVPDAKSPLLDGFLNYACKGDADILGFLQRAAGYSISGSIAEKSFFFFIGPPDSGKSTFLEALQTAMGEYCKVLPFDSLLQRDTSAVRNDIAQLAGARFVYSSEAESGKRLSEGLVKALSGGDTIAARFLYGEFFTFLPSLKLWLSTNPETAPRIADLDAALWRRCKRIPFDQSVPEAKRNPAIKEQLIDPDSEAAQAMLAWTVNGCLSWQQQRLTPPQAIIDATEAYRKEQDPILGFLEDCCVINPIARVKTQDLRRAYDAWCSDQGTKPISLNAFGERLKSRGCTPGNSHGQRTWSGIGLAESYDNTTI